MPSKYNKDPTRTPEYVISVLDAFFLRFYDDTIYVYDRKTIEVLIFGTSKGTMSLSDTPIIMDILKEWESEGRMKLSEKDSDFVTLNEAHWSVRAG